MATDNFTVDKDIASALNRIVEYRKHILNTLYDSLFLHGNLNNKRRISDHMTLCVMIDELCEAIEGEVSHV